MSKIRGDGLLPEASVKRALRSAGARFLSNPRHIAGKPDVFFPGQGVAVFVNGCFWHGCPSHFRLPKTNSEFWREKIRANARRDARVRRALNRAGISVMSVWEHSVRRSVGRTLERIRARLET